MTKVRTESTIVCVRSKGILAVFLGWLHSIHTVLNRDPINRCQSNASNYPFTTRSISPVVELMTCPMNPPTPGTDVIASNALFVRQDRSESTQTYLGRPDGVSTFLMYGVGAAKTCVEIVRVARRIVMVENCIMDDIWMAL